MKRLFWGLLWLFFLFFLLASGWQTAVAQSEPFTSTAVPTYGQNVAFRLTSSSLTPVERIDLFVQAAGAERPFTIKVVRISQSNNQLLAEVDVEPARAALPPFAEVRFWWEIQTAVGQTIRVPDQTFTYQDDRFPWRTLVHEDISVFWTGNDAMLGEVALPIVVRSRQLLDNLLPSSIVSPLHVYIYPSTADLRAGLRLGGRDWQEGQTGAELGVLLVTAVNPLTAEADLNQSIPKELANLRLYRQAPDVSLPRWYKLGIGQLAAGESVGLDELVQTAVANDTTLPLLNLCLNYPETEPEASLALGQSVSLLRSIQRQYGDQALRQLGSAYLAGTGCEAGLTQTLGMTLGEINADWLADQEPQPALLAFLGQNSLWLLLLLASFGLFALLLRK